MNKLRSSLIGAAVLVATSATMASAQGMGPQNLNPWQDCGLGSMVFPDNDTASAISNVIWDLGTTAVSSAFTAPDQCQGSSMRIAAFVAMGYDNIATETVIGEGEYLRTLLDGLNCDPSVHNAVISDMRDSFAVQLQEANYASMDDHARAESYFLDLREVVDAGYTSTCERF